MLTPDQKQTFDRKLQTFYTTLDEAMEDRSFEGVCEAVGWLAGCVEVLRDAQGVTAEIDAAFAPLRARAQRGL